MTCPERVRVLGVNVPIERSNSDQEWGSYSSNTGRISLADRGGEDVQALTLLHELMHVLEVELAIKLGEKTVTRLSAGLFQILRDNPELVSFITGERDEMSLQTDQFGGVLFTDLCRIFGVPVSPSGQSDGSDPEMARGVPTNGGGRASVPDGGERTGDGETSCPK